MSLISLKIKELFYAFRCVMRLYLFFLNVYPPLPKIYPLFELVYPHFIGTILLGLPIALLLGMKREAVGATFSIDREPNLAILSEKYGADSPESRGALGVYICGTLFGAIYLSLIASLIASTGWFHPISLAMGAGVGSGSMMAAMTGSLSIMFPDSANDIAVFAGAANLITTIVGTFICVYFSLPMANFLYKYLEPILGRKSKKEKSAGE